MLQTATSQASSNTVQHSWDLLKPCCSRSQTHGSIGFKDRGILVWAQTRPSDLTGSEKRQALRKDRDLGKKLD